MSFSDKIKVLRRWELDAFIAQAFSPELMNAQYLQDLQVSRITFIKRIISILCCFLFFRVASFSNLTWSAISHFIYGRCRNRSLS